MEFVWSMLAHGLVGLIVVCIYGGGLFGWCMMAVMCHAAIKDARYEWQYRSRWEALASMAGALFCLLFLVLIPWALFWSAPELW